MCGANIFQARYLLSPDPEFSQVGTVTQVNYLKAFRSYRDTIVGEAGTPVYKAIISTFNILLFGRDFVPVQVNASHGGDGESEDEMEQYRLMLRQDPEPPHLNPTNTDTNILLTQSSPAATMEEPRPTSISTTAESRAEEECFVVLKPEERPAPTKIPPAPPTDSLSDPVLENPIPEDSTFEDPTLENPDRPARGSKKGGRGKKAAASEQPARATRKRTK